jgi:hypothetical protein
MKKIVSLFLLLTILAAFSFNAFASDSETVTTTYNGCNYKCHLDTTWTSSNDNAYAYTDRWSDNENYGSIVEIYCNTHLNGTYYRKAIKYSADFANAWASENGVWYYKSIHYAHNYNTNTAINMTTIYDF